MRRAIVAALCAGLLLVFGRTPLSANDNGTTERLPEPALRFAKDASLRVTEFEREWIKQAEALTKCQADFAIADAGQSDSSVRDQASRLLAAAKKLLTDSKQIGIDLERFKDSLRKAATHYRDVALLCKAQAGEARSEEIKDNYLQLAKVYEAKARVANERAKSLSAPADVKPKEEAIKEGNLFLERFVEVLSIGRVSDTDRGHFAGQLKKHGERCKALAEDLLQPIEKVLEGADAQDIRAKIDEGRKAGSLPPGPKKELPILTGASWSTPVTFQGVQCVQVLRFNEDRTCVQAVYRSGAKGRGSLMGAGSATYEMNEDGYLSFRQGGLIVESGCVTLLGKDQWSYEIRVKFGAHQLEGTRLTFTREVRR